MKSYKILMTLLITGLCVSVGYAHPPTNEKKSTCIEKKAYSFDVSPVSEMELKYIAIVGNDFQFTLNPTPKVSAMHVVEFFIPTPQRTRYYIVDERIPDHPEAIGWLDRRINYKYSS